MALAGTVANVDQIRTHYTGASDDGKRFFWFTVFTKLAEALDMSENKFAIRYALAARKDEIHVAFAGLLNRAEVQRNLDAFDETWSTFMG
jgi:hypothetical protein